MGKGIRIVWLTFVKNIKNKINFESLFNFEKTESGVYL